MTFLRQFRALLQRKKLESDMAEEMRLHLEEQTRRNVESGMNAEEARYAAQRQFGNVAVLQERVRESRGWLWWEQVGQDVHFAARSLGRSPGFTAVALLTLALGIGVNSAAFSVLNALLLHTPPYPEPESIVRVFRSAPTGRSGVHSAANFLDYREQNTVFARLAAFQGASFHLGEPGRPAERLRGLSVTADFFPLLGVSTALGRTFTPEEEREGQDAVVILSHATWVRSFGSDPAVLGRSIRLDAAPVTIVGVMPAAMDDPLLWGEVAAWRPLALSDRARADRENTYLPVIGRLKADSSLPQAQAAMDALAARFATAFPEVNSGRGLELVPLGRSVQDATTRGINFMVLGLAGFVLLIACANLANLQFARQSARAREHAVRIALGASRTRLMRLVLTESLLLSSAGGGGGLVLAAWSTEAVGRTFNFGGTGLEIALDGRVLAFTCGVSLVAGLGFGLLPAWLSSRAGVAEALRQGGRSSTSGRIRHRLRNGLIVAEIALALMLLAGAGFFVRGFQQFLQRDPGWNPARLLTADVSLRGTPYSTTAARDRFYRRLQGRLTAIPGVERAAIASSLPTTGYGNGNTFVIEGRPEPAAGRSPVARTAAVSPGYFETLGIRLLAGRDFTAADDPTRPLVVVINESMARQFWPGEDPIGKRIGGASPFMSNPREVIGVVSDVRPVASLAGAESPFQFYRSLAQWNQGTATIALRSRDGPEALAPDLRRIVAELDPDQAVFRIETMRQQIDRSLGSLEAAGIGLVCFGVLGVLLAGVGIYGVISNAVTERTNEIGIRMALGAEIRDVLALIVRGGLRLIFFGVILGLAGAVGIGQLLRSIVPEIFSMEGALVLVITLGLVMVALLACWLPARRAAKIDPMVALRAE